MELVLLGSGGAVPSEERETACTMLREGEHALLIDAGSGMRRLMTEPALLDGVESLAIVLTHFHLDHILGLEYLSQVEAPRPQLYGPGAALYDVATHLVLSQGFAYPLYGTSLDELVAGVHELPLGELEIGPFRLRTRRQDRHADPVLALRFGDGLAWCTDTAYDPANGEFAGGVRVLCHDAWFTSDRPEDAESHSSGREAGLVARAAGAERLVLIHVHPRMGWREDWLLADAVAEHRESHTGKDHMRVRPGADVPSAELVVEPEP
jgi:ribonuclease BN (tRNA processing enzyme)